ncbi:MAG: long-chain fatty acid--CoA ligase [Flavobacteriales bacterium]|nr:long-chain fatty acid--CoA ligase [Candidatus Arcticimaribacter sp.]|tara:strand:- start:4061 stop:5830 length:1770 start_codon:yes stop_codon:yes gene_type:complete
MKPTKLFEFIEIQRNKTPLEKSVTTKYNGEWQSLSTEEFYQKAQQVSRSLIKLGVKKGDKIALISTNNRTEWCIMDLGILQLGAVTVPIYPTITAPEYEYVLNHSESQYCFISDVEILEKLNTVRKNIPTLKEVYSFDSIPNCTSWTSLLSEEEDSKTQELVEAAKAAVNSEDLATIIYTSGTTGVPKGVMLNHNNIVTNVISSSKRLPLEIGKTHALSFLPVCHIYERVILYIYYYKGIGIYFAESIEKISENLQEVKPYFMTAVPRLLEKVYDKIYARGAELDGIKKKLFYWAVDLGLQYEPYGANGFVYELKLKIARKLIFSKWKAALGGNLHTISSGSAALQPRLARVFSAAGITISEGYGLTETSPVLTVSDINNRGLKFGCVGKPIEGVEIKIAEDGEILCKGPNVMQGYYKDKEKTDEVIQNGYFHTGDIGEIDADGFLKITDRKKQLFKTSGGKYIAPQLIENKMKQSLFIEQIMVIGEGQKMPAAIIQPAFEYIATWIEDKNLNIDPSNEAICSCQEVRDAIQKDIDEYNPTFGKWEQVKKFELTPELWSIELGHLTPTMKVKRKVVKEKYKALFDKIYK